MTDDEKEWLRKGYKAALTTMLIYLVDPETTKESIADQIRDFLKGLEESDR